jgi:tRNA A-37 threonylcarbamoyl transferase component Bud32
VQDNTRLLIASSFDGEFGGEVDLRLIETLRVLEGRREVWLAELSATGRRVVAKKFLCGEKQRKESRKEVSGLNELKRRGVACPQLLFVAKDEDGGVWVVAEYIVNAAELGDVFFRGAKSASREAALASFAQDLLMHWRNGVYQTDAHYKNFLWNGETLYAIDVGTIRFCRGEVSIRARVKTLVRMCHRFTDEMWSMFLSSYAEEAKTDKEEQFASFLQTAEFCSKMKQGRQLDVQRFWHKCQRNCTEFERVDRGRITLLRSRTRGRALADALMRDPDWLMSQGERLKSGNTCTVQRIEWGGSRYVVKRYNRKPRFYRIRHIFSTSRVIQSWANANVLHRLGILTAEIVVACEFRKFGLLDQGYIVMECVDGETMSSFMRQPTLSEDVRSSYINETVDLFDKLYRNHIVHGDMKAKNLLASGGQIYLIDIDGMKLFLPESRFSKLFEKDRRRFLRNWEDLPELKTEFEELLSARR